MTRSLRIEYPDAIYHVTSRGNAQADIYMDDDDRIMFLETLGQVVKRFGWVCHAYCLMGNHYHLMIQTPQANLGQGMRQLNGVYTQRLNRQHHRVGHVFQGRYKAIIVDRDSYLLQLCRYIVRNPVAAGLVKQAEDWAWSSYRATVGLESVPVWLHVDWVLAQFGASLLQSRVKYRDFVADAGVKGAMWEDLSQQIYLGDADFIAQVKSHGVSEGALSEIPQGQRKAPAKGVHFYAEGAESRHEAMARAYIEGGHTMRSIAEYFEVHYATVSRAVKKWEKSMIARLDPDGA